MFIFFLIVHVFKMHSVKPFIYMWSLNTFGGTRLACIVIRIRAYPWSLLYPIKAAIPIHIAWCLLNCMKGRGSRSAVCTIPVSSLSPVSTHTLMPPAKQNTDASTLHQRAPPVSTLSAPNQHPATSWCHRDVKRNHHIDRGSHYAVLDSRCGLVGAPKRCARFEMWFGWGTKTLC